MLIYIVLLLLYLVIGFPKRTPSRLSLKQKLYLNLLLSFPLWILIAFRANSVGNDTEVYKYLFERFSSEPLSLSFISSNIEVGFISLCYYLGRLGVRFHGFLCILATINIFCFSYFFAKYSKDFGFSWLLFITLLFLPRCMNVCREMLAVSIFLLSFNFLLNRKIKYFVIFCLLLSLIHKSAFIILLVLVLLKIKNPKIRLMTTIIMCAVLLFAFEPIMNVFISYTGGKYDYLADSKYMDTDGGVAKYLILAFSFIAYYSFCTIEKRIKKKKNIDLYKMNVWRCFILMSIVLSFAGFNFGLADRASLYFTTTYLIIIPNSLSYLPNKTAVSRYCGMSLFFIAYFIIVMIYRNDWHSIVPYSFY